MRRAFTILAGVAMVCVVAYLSWLNPTRVDFRLSPSRTVHDAPLATLLVFAFGTGAILVLAAVMIQAGRRAIVTWRQDRQQRRIERIDAWEERGEQLVWTGDTQQGRALLHKASQRRPESVHALLGLAASYSDTGELDRARQLLTDAATQHATNPNLLFALAETHRAAGDRAAAIDALERLRALCPRAPRALRALRTAYVEAGRWRDAAAAQETLLGELRNAEATTSERDYLTVLRYQATIHLPDVALRTQGLENLADSRSVSVPILVSLGDALLAGGHPDDASAVWERAARGTPRTVLVDRLAAIASETRHRDRLRTLLRKLRADQVVADNVRLLTAQLDVEDGRIDEATRELGALEHPNDAPALLHQLWAAVYQHRGQHEQALAAYARGLSGPCGYHCRVCERASREWTGYCRQCNSFDSYRASVEIGLL
jgi:tetratricopeptide (TPR) repeat protein